MQVRVSIMRGSGFSLTIGVIRLVNSALAVEPEHSQLLQDILQTPINVTISGRPRELRADTECTLFLEHLHRAYTGPYVKVTPVEP